MPGCTVHGCALVPASDVGTNYRCPVPGCTTFWCWLEGGELDLGIIRDDSVSRNDAGFFTESIGWIGT
jgi:hypothetical protein